MFLKIINLKDVDPCEKESLLLVHIDHQKAYETENQLRLDPTLFAINLPFYMESEKWWKSGDFQKKRQSVRLTYYNELSTKEKNLIELVKSELNVTIVSINNSSDNTKAKTKARRIELRSSGINLFSNNQILCNLNDSAISIEIACQKYLIPRGSCFMACDVLFGLKYFINHMEQAELEIADKFLVIIDPPWENKSIKRKKNYISQGSSDILAVGQLLNKILSKLMIKTKPDIRVAIWTTEKYKEFTLNQLLPVLNMKLECCLLWHKITTNWESVKIRGSREYLIICSFSGQQASMEQGLLISIPSAIHSHKPPIGFDLPWLTTNENLIASLAPEKVSSQKQLVTDNCPKLQGIELYSRYLRQGFLSIGFECLKLQSSEMFTSD